MQPGPFFTSIWFLSRWNRYIVSQAYAIDGMEVRRFLQIACFEDMDDPQRLLRDALRPIFRKDSHLPSDYESGERKRNKVDDKYVILSSVVLQPILIIVCFYDLWCTWWGNHFCMK